MAADPAPAPRLAAWQDNWLLRRWRSVPAEPRGILLSGLFAALIFLPWLGATGLWDPWEPHYAEVARQMISRQDYVYPYWESAWFFSKPVLLMWTSALGMNLIGVHRHALPSGSDPSPPTPSGVSIYAEWALRLPVALQAVLACALVYLAVSRLASRRAGLLSAAALATTPFYALMARQATADMPFVALMTSGSACFAVALWDERAHRTAWAYAGYLFLALATLAKGLLGFALPAAAFLAWFVVSGDWRRLSRLRLAERVGGLWLPLGPLLFLLAAAPWYAVLSLFPGHDDESKTFAYRFFIHDHLKRLGEGVHTTTPKGSFAYFLEQLGYGVFPWVAALPGALGELVRAQPRERDPRQDLALFAGLWAAIAYATMSLSSTKFHHYIFPAVPALAILCGLFLDRLWEEGPQAHLPALLLGLAAFAAVGHSLWVNPKALPDLFVYNYDRPYPERELMELHPGAAVGPLLLSLAPRPVMSALFAAGGAGLFLAGAWRSRRGLVAGTVALAAVFAVWLSWFHWRELSPHWSQRDLLWTYLSERSSPDEPIAAYYMNWRGETFYSRNLVRQVQDSQKIKDYAARPGRKWILTERSRFPGLRSAVGAQVRLRIADRSDNKFYLVAAEGAPPGAVTP
jgi:4-amino-4-deoxy-L-arabinose transferase-like glycosyltransferase